MPNPACSGFLLGAESESGLQWTLRRNCSAGPSQLAVVFGTLGVLSLVVALFFWFLGAVLVLPFAALEVLALGTAFLLTARHATDGELIRLRDGRLVVEVESAGRVERSEFVAHWVRVQPEGDHGLVVLTGGGRTVTVGRFVRADLRPVLAREIALGLREGGVQTACLPCMGWKVS